MLISVFCPQALDFSFDQRAKYRDVSDSSNAVDGVGFGPHADSFASGAKSETFRLDVWSGTGMNRYNPVLASLPTGLGWALTPMRQTVITTSTTPSTMGTPLPMERRDLG